MLGFLRLKRAKIFRIINKYVNNIWTTQQVYNHLWIIIEAHSGIYSQKYLKQYDSENGIENIKFPVIIQKPLFGDFFIFWDMCFIDFSFYCFSDIKCSKFAYWIPLHDFSRMGLYVFAVVFVCMCTWSPAPMSSSIRFSWTPFAILTDCCSIATKRFSVRQSKPTFFELWIFGCHLVAVVDQLGQSQYTNMQKRSIVQQTMEHGTRLLAVF